MKFVIEITDFENAGMKEDPLYNAVQIVTLAVNKLDYELFVGAQPSESFRKSLLDANGNTVGFIEWKV